MNVKEINPGTKGSFPHYVMTVVPLTLLSIWVIIAFQSKYYMKGQSVWKRFLWPVTFFKALFAKEEVQPERPYHWTSDDLNN